MVVVAAEEEEVTEEEEEESAALCCDAPGMAVGESATVPLATASMSGKSLRGIVAARQCYCVRAAIGAGHATSNCVFTTRTAEDAYSPAARAG